MGVSIAVYSALDGPILENARFVRVLGMSDRSSRSAVEQHDALGPLVRWVEQGAAPGCAPGRALLLSWAAGTPAP